MITLTAEGLLIYLGADFLSGLFHWIEDTYLDHHATNPFIRYVATLNEEHHETPHKFTDCHPLENILTSIPIYLSAMVIFVLVPIQLLSSRTTIVLSCMFTLALFANIFHRWCHVKPPRIVKVLQDLKILQTPHHHCVHHFVENAKIPRLAKGAFYCVIGNVMNPLLESINFWRGLEWVIFKTFGLKPLWYDL